MKKRYAVLGLSMVLALALAVPALGGPTNPIANVSADAKTTAQKALKQARAAKKAANAAKKSAKEAKDTANAANGAAGAASTAAGKAQKAAEAAQSTADAAKAAADSAKALAATKMSDPSHVEGEPGSSVSSAGCGSKTPTGGGFIVTGADNDAATVTESTQYLSGWIVIADQIEGTTGTNWEVVATVNCATAP